MENRSSIPRESTSAVSRWRAAAAFVAAAVAVDSVLALLACNGTTGRPDLVLPPTSLADANPDSTLGDAGDAPATEGGEGGDEGGIYTGLFDVAIVYADRDLPDITPAPSTDGGGEGGGFPFPTNCPPYISVAGHTPVPITSGGANDEVPADSTSDGGSTFAADGSVCLYPWFGSKAIDQCTTSIFAIDSNADFPGFPPCNWCPPGSGSVVQGPNPGEDRTLACLTLYQCMIQSQCYLDPEGVGACLCGSEPLGQCQTDLHPSGPCVTAELEALETTDPEHALNYFTLVGDPMVSGSLGTPGSTCGSFLNYVFLTAGSNACFPPIGDP